MTMSIAKKCLFLRKGEASFKTGKFKFKSRSHNQFLHNRNPKELSCTTASLCGIGYVVSASYWLVDNGYHVGSIKPYIVVHFRRLNRRSQQAQKR